MRCRRKGRPQETPLQHQLSYHMLWAYMVPSSSLIQPRRTGVSTQERLQHNFTANDVVSDEKRKAFLLNMVGTSTYCLIRTLVSPSKVTIANSQAVRFQYQETRGRRVHSHVRSGTSEDRRVLRVRNGIKRHASRPSLLWDKQLLQESDLTFEKALQVALSTAAGTDSKMLTSSSGDKRQGKRPPISQHTCREGHRHYKIKQATTGESEQTAAGL